MADSNLNVNINGRDNLSPVVNQLESKLIRFVGAVSSAVAAMRVATFPIAAAGNFERELANVQKTTEFSKYEIASLGAEIEKLSLRLNVSAVDLAKVAAAAGQQGLGTLGPEGIAMFTESVSRMASVLDITADQAANDVGKLINIFKVSVNDLERIASTFNETSNNSTASGEELLDVVRRIGDAAGTVNLQESLGLAATGIDFGMSPEVVGTSYGKIFADMRAKAEDFATLMKMTTEQWVNYIDVEGGINAYKAYLARLRELGSAEQAKAISELSGRGRIFALVNKNVQDTQNNVLDRNLAFAAEGWIEGTSAIREQQTVLETLNEQYVILKNSIFSVSTEAGDQVIGPLTANVAELSEALQTPAVKSFIAEVGASMADLIASIVAAVKEVASWNVNWENLITLAKVFVSIKLLEMLGSMAGRIGLVNAAYLRLTATTRAAISGIDGVNQAGTRGGAAQTTSLRNIIGLWTNRAAAIRAAAAAEEAHNRAVNNNRELENRLNYGGAATRDANRAVGNANYDRAMVGYQVEQARKVAQRMEETERSKFNSKIEAATNAHNAKLAAINAAYRSRDSAFDQAAKAGRIAAEERHFNRVLSSTNAYYARTIGAARTHGLQLIAQAEAEQARLQQVYARAEAARLAAMGQTARARALLERSDAAVRTSAENLRRTQEAADRAGRAFFNFGTIIAGLGAALRIGLSAIMGLFFWATLLYSALDAFGLLDGLGGFFLKLGDAIGLTSEAKRKAAQESKELKEQLEKERKEVQELTEEYSKLIDKSTGRVSDVALGGATGQIKGGGAAAQQSGLTQIGQGLIAADAEVDATTKATKNYGQSILEATQNVERLREKLKEANEAEKNALSNQGWRQRKKDIEDYTSQLVAAERRLKFLSEASRQDMTALSEAAAANRQTLSDTVNSLFTNESAALFKQFIDPIRQAQLEAEALRKKRQEAAQAEISAGNDPELLAKRQEETRKLDEELVALNGRIATMQTAFKKASDAILNDSKITDAVKNSIAFLSQFLELRGDVFNSITRTLTGNQAAGQTLTGANVPNRPPASSGSDVPDDPKDQARQESEARKRGRARLQLARAQAEAEAALRREVSDQIGTIEDRAYRQGLTSIDNYFAARQKRQLANNQIEIDAARRQVKIVERERRDRAAMGAEQSELLRYDADLAKLKGEIAVLQERRNAIRGETKDDITDAYDALKAKINSTSVELADALGVQDIDAFFKQNLAEYNERYKEFYAQLTSEGTEEAKALLEALGNAGQLEAVAAAISVMRKETDAAYSDLDRFTTRLEMLRDASALTTAEFEAQAQRARATTAAQIQVQIAAQEAALERMTTAAQRSSEAYKQQMRDLDEAKLRLQQLQSVANQVAVDINRSLQQGIQNSLNTLLGGSISRELNDAQRNAMRDNDSAVERLRNNIAALERARSGVTAGYGGETSALDAQIAKAQSDIAALEAKTRDIQQRSRESFLNTIKDAASGFGISLAQSIQDAATKKLSEQAMQGLGNLFGGPTAGGGGGVGGFFADLLGGSELGTDSNPMVTREAVGTDISKTLQGKEGPVAKLFDTFKDKTKGILDNLGDGLGDTFSSLTSSLGDMLSGLFGGGSGSGWGGIASAIGSWFGSFHTGGVVGMSMQPRFAHPAVFANAVRYHTGGIAGLAPDEVPAILRRGEEVLTAGDARHRNNVGGGDGSTSVVVNVNMETGTTSVEAAQTTALDAHQLGKRIAAVVQSEIINQKRPGGLLSK